MADLLIHQTSFRQILEKSKIAKIFCYTVLLVGVASKLKHVIETNLIRVN